MAFFGVIVWLLLCILIGKCAERWDRSFAKYMALSILFSPLIMGIILLIMGRNVVPMGTKYSNESVSSFGSTWTCPKCGDRNPLSNSFCKGCGGYKPAGVGSNEFKNAIPSVQNIGDDWTCKKCNEKNSLNDTYCKSCGAYK